MPQAKGKLEEEVTSVPRTPSNTKVHGAAIVASVILHAVLAAVGFSLALRSLHPEPPSSIDVESPGVEPSSPAEAIQLPVVGDGVPVDRGPLDPTGDPPRVGGGDSVARLDRAKGGTGGDPTVDAPALNLADVDERMRLSPDLVSRIDRDQLQRLRVASHRQSWEDRRSTTHPMELTLLVSGQGPVLERRPDAPSSPSRGVQSSPQASVQGGEPGRFAEEGQGDRPPGGAPGAAASEPGAGLPDARVGLDHRASAPIARARPDVTEGPVAVPAKDPARPRDDVDSDQEVATTVRSLVHASTAGGAPGDGRGGTAGGGEAGAGGSEGQGSRAHPMGLGEGDIVEYWSGDPRLLPWFRQVHARIDPRWANAFPKSAALDLRQGTVIFLFTVTADGRVAVHWPPARPSGIDEFDRNVADAIRSAAPLPPIPRELGVSTLTTPAGFPRRRNRAFVTRRSGSSNPERRWASASGAKGRLSTSATSSARSPATPPRRTSGP